MGELEAVLAVFLFTFLPAILAHSGLATTDMPVTAMISAAFLCCLVWLEKPTPRNGVLFGLLVGLAVLCKFSALAFLPAAMGAALLWYIVRERPGMPVLLDAARKRLPSLGLGVLTGMLVIWAGYRFSMAGGLPAPALWSGIHDVMEHNRLGHPSYLFGERSLHGFWYYYPVMLAVKTPLPFLALLLFGAFSYKRSKGVWLALAFALGILLFAMTGGINIGVRHILPMYLGFSLVAAAGAVRLLEMADRARWAPALVAAAFVWMLATSLLSHPDYLPYFNALAGDEPEKIAADSDLDWGQDLNRVGKRLKELGAPSVAISSFVVARLTSMHGFPPTTAVNPMMPTPGWNAISITSLKVGRLGLGEAQPDLKLWPDQVKPAERVGKGMWLYYFPPQTGNMRLP
jgi:4-amino-4-deoxy-L-arabinose transferase-like glycosyltransferase